MSFVPIQDFVPNLRKNLRYNIKTTLIGLDIGNKYVGAAIGDLKTRKTDVC